MFKKKNPCSSCGKGEDLKRCKERIAQLETHVNLLCGLLENHCIEVPKKIKDDAELKCFSPMEYIYNELYLIRNSMNLDRKLLMDMYSESLKRLFDEEN